MTALIKPNTCSSCGHRVSDDGKLFCTFAPPTATAVAMPGPRPGEVAVHWMSSFPPVDPTWSCHQWTALSRLVSTIDGEAISAN